MMRTKTTYLYVNFDVDLTIILMDKLWLKYWDEKIDTTKLITKLKKIS
jgi:hypothetical protein